MRFSKSYARIFSQRLRLYPHVFAACLPLLLASFAAAATLPDQIDDYLSRLTGFGYSGSILVVVDGKVTLRKGYGYADLAKRIPNAPATLFDIGSLSKTLTATAALQLDAAGKLSVADPISRYIEHVPADKRSITVRQLLSHTSGITAPSPAYEAIAKQAAIERILKTPLKFPPGSKWDYSNADYVLLAAVIEAASGDSYQHYMIQHVFRPAGMKSTGFWGSALPHGPHLMVAQGYDEFGVVTDLHQLSSETWNDIGSGQIVSNIDDLYRFLSRLLKGRLIPMSELQAMLTPVIASPPSNDYYTDSYGYGLWINTLPDGGIRYQHGGDFLGFGSQLTWIPKEHLVLISLCNVRRELYPVHRRADRAVPQIITGQPVPEPPSFASASASANHQFEGTYELSSGGRIAVYNGPWGLEVGADGQDGSILLNGSFEHRAELEARGVEAADLMSALFHGDDSRLAAVGLGDAADRQDIHKELDSLSKGHGEFQGVRNVGTYVGGMLGRFEESVLKVSFERGSACYKIEWSGSSIAGTDERKCPKYAAATLARTVTDHELVGWNIITAKQVSLKFTPDYSAVQITAGGHTETAHIAREQTATPDEMPSRTQDQQ